MVVRAATWGFSRTTHLRASAPLVAADTWGANGQDDGGIQVEFLRNLSVRAKLFGGFGVVLALTLVLGVVMISQLGSVNGISNTLSSSDFPSVVAINSMGLSLNDYESSTPRGHH